MGLAVGAVAIFPCAAGLCSLVQYVILAKKKNSRPALTRQGRERMPLWDIPRFVFN
jgi:hypothetical protein